MLQVIFCIHQHLGVHSGLLLSLSKQSLSEYSKWRILRKDSASRTSFVKLHVAFSVALPNAATLQVRCYGGGSCDVLRHPLGLSKLRRYAVWYYAQQYGSV
jgi:hypothetical protein